MRTLTSYLLLVIFLWTFSSCGKDEKKCRYQPTNNAVEVNVDITRLDRKLAQIESKNELNELLNKHKSVKQYFLDSKEYPHDSLLINRLYALLNDVHIKDTLIVEIKNRFGSLDHLKSRFSTGFKNLKYYFPTADIPKIKTIFTGFYKDLLISDSLVVVGLDYYLGKQGTYIPNDVPGYIMDRYREENLAPIVFNFLANNINLTNYGDNTLLNEMIGYGKNYFFTSMMLPCTPDSLIIGYSSEAMDEINDNIDVIWAHFIENELLFETNHFIKNKYIGERPNVYEIGEKCPGRIGRWLGWLIVKAYMNRNPNVSLAELMSQKDAQLIFRASNFKPG
ncbi:MAG TPA: gliding motility lipoprotein GldB [Cyclobacteriaceae bacterium]